MPMFFEVSMPIYFQMEKTRQIDLLAAHVQFLFENLPVRVNLL